MTSLLKQQGLLDFETKNKEVEKKTYNTPHKMQG
jgi:hypothetical protein